MKKKLIQIVYDMRTQPVVAWVTIIGTALSIFLIMTVMMMQQVKIISIAPESHRDRMLYGMFLHEAGISSDAENESSAGLSYETAKKLYDKLDGVEEISYVEQGWASLDLKGTNNKKFTGDVLYADDGIWRVFDYELLDGRYYTPEEVDAGTKVAVVSRSTARKLFDSEDALGRRFELDHETYEVIGMVADVSKLTFMAYGEVFAPLDKSKTYGESDSDFGPYMTLMRVKDGVDLEDVRAQVKKRYGELDAEIASRNMKTVYHGAPFDQETVAGGVGGSNITPQDTNGLRIVIYLILLLVPAINLSSMLHSRLRRRVSELGVRRAFGCTRKRIMGDIIVENLIVTVAGGIIGFAVGVLFALFYDGLYTSPDDETVRPALSMLLNWRILLSAFGACFILNILSASVPAWQASRLNPVEAINAK